MLKDTCPHCGRILRFQDAQAGQPANCDRCGGAIMVPEPAAGPAQRVGGRATGTQSRESADRAPLPREDERTPTANSGSRGESAGASTDGRSERPALEPPGRKHRKVTVVTAFGVGVGCFAALVVVAVFAVFIMPWLAQTREAATTRIPKQGAPQVDERLASRDSGASTPMASAEEPAEEPAESEEPPIPVHFADPGLEAAVREAIRKPAGDIVQSDLVGKKFRTLNAGGRKIRDLRGIEHCSDLTRLELRANSIRDIAPLSALTKLTWLRIAGNEVRDITPLQSLRAITIIGLEGNQISDLTPLSHLTRLKTLSVMNNRVYDVTPLARLEKLESLLLDTNQIADVTPLGELKNLKMLRLRYNQVHDVGPLGGLTKLHTLLLGANQIHDVSPLASLPYLRELGLAHNQIKDISPLLRNIGLNNGDTLNLIDNPLEEAMLGAAVAELKARGVSVSL